ncbi:hypothetical protein [Insolitispirillum peregrinum]|uniref:Hydrogenase maturation protease n=1 Tax=Insolitispirillum peregrinum TaxID=80876 RepID=A0A1N7JR54_9PROT|nr:hypothetical protein [Insolitispirillum peregrinum]SIS51823.1 hydrogenase maturation protease [Insolitispirillum peregrinum]
MSERLTLILGLGQPGQGDAACGLQVAETLKASALATDPSVVIMTHIGDGEALLHLLRTFERVILIGGMMPFRKEPDYHGGKIVELCDWQINLPLAMDWASPARGLSITNALALAYSTGAWPDRLMVYGITGEQWWPGAPLSDEVQAILPEISQRITATVSAWLGHP